MIKPLVAAVAGIGLLGTAVGVYVVASPGGGEEEAVQQLATPTATLPLDSPLPTVSPTIPAGLPTPPDGYTWYVAPTSGFGLASYDVQVPADWDNIYPGDSNPRWFTPRDSAVTQFSPKLVIKVTPPGPWTAEVFRFELPRQGGTFCGIVADGKVDSGAGEWTLYSFECPEEEGVGNCEASAEGAIVCAAFDPRVELKTVQGRAAELKQGDQFFSVLVFAPEALPAAAAAFDKAVTTLAPK